MLYYGCKGKNWVFALHHYLQGDMCDTERHDKHFSEFT